MTGIPVSGMDLGRVVPLDFFTLHSRFLINDIIHCVCSGDVSLSTRCIHGKKKAIGIFSQKFIQGSAKTVLGLGRRDYALAEPQEGSAAEAYPEWPTKLGIDEIAVSFLRRLPF